MVLVSILSNREVSDQLSIVCVDRASVFWLFPFHITAYPAALSQFDFYRCKSDYMGTPTSDFDGDYGVLRPTGDTENCVQTSE